MSGAVHPWTAPVALALVLAGVWWLATVDSLVRARVAGAGWRAVALAPVDPLRSGLRLLLKETRSTECRTAHCGAPRQCGSSARCLQRSLSCRSPPT
jgi:hypothetical protein